jgi:hypothetical protein
MQSCVLTATCHVAVMVTCYYALNQKSCGRSEQSSTYDGMNQTKDASYRLVTYVYISFQHSSSEI